jgi:hypothetical protein
MTASAFRDVAKALIPCKFDFSRPAYYNESDKARVRTVCDE